MSQRRHSAAAPEGTVKPRREFPPVCLETVLRLSLLGRSPLTRAPTLLCLFVGVLIDSRLAVFGRSFLLQPREVTGES